MVQKKFSIGQKVWLRYSSQLAVVSDNADNDIIYVITEDLEIPVFAEDVDSIIPDLPFTKSVTAQKQPKELINQFDGSAEVKIAFEQLFDGEQITGFKVYFIGAPTELVKVKYAWYEGKDLFFTHSFHPISEELIFLHTLEFDQLNESPEIELEVKIGIESFQKSIRIKPKSFFNKLVFVPQLNKEVYLFPIEFSTEKKVEQNPEEFKIDTSRLKQAMQAKPSKSKTVLNGQQAERVIDLHIEKIVKEFKHLSNNDIVEIQLNYFQRSLSAAMRSHLGHMFVIHGLGKGVLKSRVFDILKSYPGIKEYKNNYHPLFGWGATEITFK